MVMHLFIWWDTTKLSMQWLWYTSPLIALTRQLDFGEERLEQAACYPKPQLGSHRNRCDETWQKMQVCANNVQIHHPYFIWRPSPYSQEYYMSVPCKLVD